MLVAPVLQVIYHGRGKGIEAHMKRTIIFIIAVFAATLIAASASAQEFLKPILVGGDATDQNDKTQTRATHLMPFVHPANPNAKNFADPSGKVPLPNGQGNFYVDDVAATPGSAASQFNNVIQPNSPMLDHPDVRVQGSTLSPLNGIGPSDFDWNTDGFRLILGVDLQFSNVNNKADSHLFLGDIRKEDPTDVAPNPDETNILFTMYDALVPGVIGSADLSVTPYVDVYPSPVKNDETEFKWCVAPQIAMPWKGWDSSCSTSIKQTSIGQTRYSKDNVFLYGLADIGNGIVSASYDPILVGMRHELYGKIDVVTSPPASDEKTKILSTGPKDYYLYPYYSPLVFFRNVEEGNSHRYRFTGYSSWYMPTFDSTKPPADQLNIWPFIYTNWIVPVATNPISVRAIDAHGASSWRNCPDKEACLKDHPDTDLSVAYQTTLFDLTKPVYDLFGRPAVNSDYVQKMGEILGTCEDPPTCTQFTPLKPSQFPDNVVSLVLTWRQKNKWAQGADNQDYVNSNPSHVFEPMPRAAIVGPGVYDTVVLTDFANDQQKRNQHVIVPSSVLGVSSGTAYLYDINKDNKKIYFKEIKAEVKNFGGIGKVCGEVPTNYNPTPFVLPDLISLQSQNGNFVPYQMRGGNLDGDDCEDLIVTWRGKNTINDPDHQDHVKFDNGSGQRFSNTVTIVLRREDAAGKCELTDAANYNGIPTSISIPLSGLKKPEIASAAIGDFDGDTVNDIIAGDLNAEAELGGQPTAYAYLFKGFAKFSMPRPIQVGVHSGNGAIGVGMIEADRTQTGPDVMMQINGLPLMLPEIGCPNYDDANDKTKVASIFETYVSELTDMMALWAYQFKPDLFNKVAPFMRKTGDTLVSQRCVANGDTYYNTTNVCVKNGVILPLYEEDPCCTNCKSSPACSEYLMRYGSKFSCAVYNYAKGNCFTDNSPPLCTWNPPPKLVPLREQLKTTANAIFGNNTYDAIIEADPNLKRTENILNGMLNFNKNDAVCYYENLIGPPTSLEDYFERYIKLGYLASVTLKPPQAPPGNCSLIVPSNAAADVKFMELINSSFSKIKNWLVDLIVPPADAGGPLPTVPDISKIPLPKGTFMPGHREITAVVLKPGPDCNRDGKKDSTEECDTANMTASEKKNSLAQWCTNAAAGIPIACEMAHCTCVYEQQSCKEKMKNRFTIVPGPSVPVAIAEPAIDCAKTTDCAQGQICDVDCKCQGLGTLPVEPSASGDTCSTHCMQYSSDSAKEMYDKLNADMNSFKAELGVVDDSDTFCEPAQPIIMLCQIAGATAKDLTAAQISAQLTGTPIYAQNRLPYSFRQLKGPVPDIALADRTYLGFTPFPEGQKLRLLPVEGTTTSGQVLKSVIVPDIAADATPVTVNSITAGPTGAQVVNNMYFELYSSANPGETITWQTASGKASKAITPSPGPSGVSTMFDQITYTLSYPCASWTGVEGYEGCPPIEERHRELSVFKDELKANIAAGMSWPEAMRQTSFDSGSNYSFNLVQQVYTNKGEAPKVLSLDAGVIAGLDLEQGQGGCGKCNLSQSALTLDSMLPAILVILAPVFGIALRRKWRKP